MLAFFVGGLIMRGLQRLFALAALASAILTAGCDTLLIPASGPNAVVIRSQETWHGPPYGYVTLSPQTVHILEEFGPRTLTGIFGDHRPPPEITFGIGDVISVSIFEAAAGGLFIPAEASVRPGNFVTLPNSTDRYQRFHFSALCRPRAGRRQDPGAGRERDR